MLGLMYGHFLVLRSEFKDDLNDDRTFAEVYKRRGLKVKGDKRKVIILGKE